MINTCFTYDAVPRTANMARDGQTRKREKVPIKTGVNESIK